MKHKILIINPNCTTSMTTSLESMLKTTTYAERYDLTLINPTTGVPSINNEDDANESLTHCISLLQQSSYIDMHDAFLVACYSFHPLVQWLEIEPTVHATKKPVMGIFEASVLSSLRSISKEEKYGIVSTGKVWEQLLTEGIKKLSREEGREDFVTSFSSVETTGLNATELHDLPPSIVGERIRHATKRLVKNRDVQAICLGCAGMTGMDELVREALKEELGAAGGHVMIVDGVSAGVKLLGEQLDQL